MSQYYTEKQNVYVPGKGYDEYEVTVEIEDGDYNPTKRSTTIETRDGVRYVNGVPAYKIPGTLEYNELHKGDQK